jgi:hypothetical protein
LKEEKRARWEAKEGVEVEVEELRAEIEALVTPPC